NDYVVGEVSFNNTTGPSSPYSTDPVGFKRTTVVTPAGVEIDVWDACAELFVGPTGGSTYTVTPGLSASGWNATQIEQVETLYSNALVLFTGELGDYDAARPFGAAIQMALWEIAEETAGSLDLTAGNFNVAGSDLDTATTDAITLATQWINNIQSGTWTNQPGVNLFYADSAGEQDRLWAVLSVTPTSLPEPSTALFTLIGGALLVSRRRR
ncbi:MAG: PEP-CTERM sorting domain-containing protein, partial [Haloferula sp.]